MVTIGTNTNYVALNPVNLCLSNPTLNLYSVLTNTTLSGTTFTLNTTPISSPYTFGSAGQYSLYASNTSTSLCTNGTYSTLVNVYSAAAPWFTEGGYTVGSATICSSNIYTATANSSSSNFLWQPGALSGANQLLSPTVTTIYTVSAFNYSLCAASSTFAIKVATNCCNGSTVTPFTATAITSSTLFTGSLLIGNDVTIPAYMSLNISSCNLQFLNNAKLIVKQYGFLNIQGSHLYSCDNNLWTGIVVQDGGNLSATAGTHDNLIEDALTAVDVSNNTNTSGALDIHNTIFNKNYVSISISNYSQAATPAPFTIDNSVFTCRALPFTSTAWPSVGASSSTTGVTAQLKTAITVTTGLISPYLSQSGFSITTLKSPYLTKCSHAAISLLNAGLTNTNTSAANIFTFFPITIGSASSATAFVLFDAHESFISTSNSNLKVENCAFQNTQIFSVIGNVTASSAIQFTNGSSYSLLDLSAASVNVGSRFWNCHTAVNALDATSLKIENALFRSTQSNTAVSSASFISVGEKAIFISSNKFHEYSIQNNEFTNLRDAVLVGVTQFTTGNPNYLNILSISNNTFSPYLSTAYTGLNTGAYINTAISLVDPLADIWTTAPTNTNGIAIESNLFYRVYNGLLLNGITPHYSHNTSRKKISANTIILEESFFGGAQTGIDHVNTLAWYAGGSMIQSIEQNSITLFSGNITNTNVTLMHAFNNNIYGGFTGYLICNTLTAAYQGFVFDGPNYSTYWRGNTMTGLARGMTLLNAGVIGIQGTSLTPSDNKWTGGWGSNFALYTAANSTAQTSPLYIRSGTSLTPPTYGGGGFLTNLWYNASGGTLTAVTGTYLCGGSYSQKTSSLPNAGDYNSAELFYIAKALFYTGLIKNDSIRGTNPAYQSFCDALSGTSIAKFTQVEDYLRGNNLTSAATTLAGIDQGGFNSVEVNYYAFYTLYLKYKNATPDAPFSSSDLISLTNLAGLCPGTNGAPVYQARALYQRIKGKAFDASGSCSGGAARIAHFNETSLKTDQEWDIKLFPNPAQDLLSIVTTKENEFLHVTIIDLSGRVLLEKDLKTFEKVGDLSLNLINGAYIITVSNSQGERVNKTLIIAK